MDTTERSNRTHYWITASDPEDGQPILIYGAPNEEAARAKGLEMLPSVDFKLVPLPTIDRDRASAIIRGKRLEKTHSIHESRRKIGHEKTVARMNKRKRRHPENTNFMW